MKWGVRKAEKPPTSNDAAKASAYLHLLKTGGTRALTTKDLQELVTRMNLEQQYARLKPPSKGKMAAKFITDTLLQIGKQQITKLATDQLTKLIESQFKK
jgi:L-asparaginase/Glu-tRNA(Gln) amidotransferase subunit D